MTLIQYGLFDDNNPIIAHATTHDKVFHHFQKKLKIKTNTRNYKSCKCFDNVKTIKLVLAVRQTITYSQNQRCLLCKGIYPYWLNSGFQYRMSLIFYNYVA